MRHLIFKYLKLFSHIKTGRKINQLILSVSFNFMRSFTLNYDYRLYFSAVGDFSYYVDVVVCCHSNAAPLLPTTPSNIKHYQVVLPHPVSLQECERLFLFAPIFSLYSRKNKKNYTRCRFFSHISQFLWAFEGLNWEAQGIIWNRILRFLLESI